MRTTTAAALASAAALSLLAADAQALDVPSLDFKVGIRGGASLPLMLEPSNSTQSPHVPYASYYGIGYHFGLMLNFRALDIIGLETGWYRSYDNISGTIELDDVRESGTDGRLRKVELIQRFRTASDHIPIVAQVTIPISSVRPFFSVGVDLTVNRTNRSYEVESAGDPIPGIDEDGMTAELAADWARSPRGQNALRATLDSDPGVTAGIVAGLGVNVALDKVELPIELRAVLTPGAGTSLSDRGTFPDSGIGDTRYNDVWSTQVFLTLGLDYLIF